MLSRRLFACLLAATAPACKESQEPTQVLHWYSYNEPSGAFAEAAERCSEAAAGTYRIMSVTLPADADQQREQLVRRLAAEDRDIDLIGMDVIWTAEFAEAGWILSWPEEIALQVVQGRLPASVQSARYRDRLWAAPFTSNGQLLWYRRDRVKSPPSTWAQMIAMAEAGGRPGALQAQGERYEGLTVLFVSLLASAGGAILDDATGRVSLADGPTRTALTIMKRLATSPAADPALATAREDQARLAFATGVPDFMVNYSYVWPSIRANAPELAAVMGWARWPGVLEGHFGRAVIGGLNLGVSAHSRHPQLAFRAAACLVSATNQKLAAERGGLPPTIEALYDDPAVRRTFPFADMLRETLRDAAQRPKTPLYSDISLAIARLLHPMQAIDPEHDGARLRAAITRALSSEGLL